MIKWKKIYLIAYKRGRDEHYELKLKSKQVDSIHKMLTERNESIKLSNFESTVVKS